jgi:hypothetical protein
MHAHKHDNPSSNFREGMMILGPANVRVCYGATA